MGTKVNLEARNMDGYTLRVPGVLILRNFPEIAPDPQQHRHPDLGHRLCAMAMAKVRIRANDQSQCRKYTT